MVAERSTRLRDPEREKIYRTNSGVGVDLATPFSYAFDFDENGYWYVRDTETGIFGHGETPSGALEDFYVAAAQHLDVLEREPALSGELSRQLEYLRARIQR